MKIGELAKRSGLTASRIRFYEASGLIKSVERRSNGYREYGPEALWTLEMISSAQCAGFSLDEIRALLPDDANAWPHDQLLGRLKQKVVEIEQLQQRLDRNRKRLLIAIGAIESQPEGLAAAERTQWMLGRLREEHAGAPPPSARCDSD